MNPKIQLLYLIDKLQAAGAQRHLLRLILSLDRNRFEPHVVCMIRGGEVAEKLTENGIPVEVLGFESIYEPKAWAGMRRLTHRLKQLRIEILHTYLTSANIFGTLCARMAGVPIVITTRRDTGFSRNWRLRMIEEWLINPRADCVVAVSPAIAKLTQHEKFLSEDKIITIPNGIDTTEWAPTQFKREEIRQRWNLTEGETCISVIAHLSPIKGHGDLLNAAARVVAKNPRAKFFIIGDGILKASLEERTRLLGLASHVVFTGHQNNIAEMLSLTDILVIPSHSEGMSNTLLESMAMGKPVVATAVGGNLDVVVEGVTGLLVPPRDEAALANALLSLMTHPEKCEAMGRAARVRIETCFSIERMAKEYETLYGRLLKKHD